MMVFSQNKRELVNFEKIAAFTLNIKADGKSEVVANYETARKTVIGEYNSLERAKEVLQLISQSYATILILNMPEE